MKIYSIYLWRFLCLILSTISITFFWQNVVLTTTLLIVFAILINFKSNRSEIISYIVVAILATLLEALASYTGAWKYSYSNILTFPIWLPLYWGIGGIVMKDVYNIISKIKL